MYLSAWGHNSLNFYNDSNCNKLIVFLNELFKFLLSFLISYNYLITLSKSYISLDFGKFYIFFKYLLT
jgi:hypothetical protein